MWQVVTDDNRAMLYRMADESVHAVICDPPYGLAFMGKKWDYTVPDIEVWKECLRVLKPGGHLLAFGGARTYHRLAVSIEDAGFELMSMLGWLYGSGFPKATDLSKQIDKRAGKEREVVGYDKSKARPNRKYKSGAIGNIGGGVNDSVCDRTDNGATVTAPATKEAEYWDGYKYSISPLKPALEPICMARKPFNGKPVDSILKHEVGACNIDACRVPTDDSLSGGAYAKSGIPRNDGWEGYERGKAGKFEQPEGRYPANLLLDPEGAKVLGEQSGELKGPWGKDSKDTYKGKETSMFKIGGVNSDNERRGKETGTASRFFNQFGYENEPPFLYCAKASKKEKDAGGVKNIHPTVKPISLMRWLVKLVTREGQLVVDPFCGSGTTGCACVMERRNFLGIELETNYAVIAENRIAHWEEQAKGES